MSWKNNNKIDKIKQLNATDWPARYIFGLALENKFYDILEIFAKHTNIELEIYFENIISIKKNKKDYEILSSNQKNFMETKF